MRITAKSKSWDWFTWKVFKISHYFSSISSNPVFEQLRKWNVSLCRTQVLISSKNASQPCTFILRQGHQLVDNWSTFELVPHGIQIIRFINEEHSIHCALSQFSKLINAIILDFLSSRFLEDILAAQFRVMQNCGKQSSDCCFASARIAQEAIVPEAISIQIETQQNRKLNKAFRT